MTQTQLRAGAWESLPRAGQVGAAPAGFVWRDPRVGRALLNGPRIPGEVLETPSHWKLGWAQSRCENTRRLDEFCGSCRGELPWWGDPTLWHPRHTPRVEFSCLQDGVLFPARCFVPRNPSGIPEDLGCVRRVNTRMETYPGAQNVPVSGGDASPLVSVPVTPISSPEKRMYSSEGEISLCVYSYLTLFTQKMEKHIFKRHVRFEIMSVQQAVLILQTSTPPCGVWEPVLLCLCLEHTAVLLLLFNGLCEAFQSSELKMQKAGEEERVCRAGVLCSWSVRMSCYLIALEYVGLNEPFLMNNRQMHKSRTPSTQTVKHTLMKTCLGWQVCSWFVKRREYIVFEMIFMKRSKCCACCPYLCPLVPHSCSSWVPQQPHGSATVPSRSAAREPSYPLSPLSAISLRGGEN